MLKIGEFSRLSMLTVKALRFYEKEGLLLPAQVDGRSGYRFYAAAQLETAAVIRALRQLDFSVEEVRAHLNGFPLQEALRAKKAELQQRRPERSVSITKVPMTVWAKPMPIFTAMSQRTGIRWRGSTGSVISTGSGTRKTLRIG